MPARAALLLLLTAILACGGEPGRATTDAAAMITSAADTTGTGDASTSSGAPAETGTPSGDGSSGASTSDAPGTSGGPEAPLDAAAIVGHTLPEAAGCGESIVATVTVENTGAATWTRDALYKLGAVDDEDPLTPETRVWLPEGASVPPGGEFVFELELQAPDEPGAYTSDWRMVHEYVTWFGEQAATTLVVSCEALEPPPLALEEVIWLHTDVSSWPVTMTLESVTFEGELVCLNHGSQDEGVFVWPEKDEGDGAVVGNPWVFIYEDGAWYGATWEWLRPDQTCKFAYAVAGDHIKQAPFDVNSGWTPKSGQTLYFMVSALARLPDVTNVSERSAPIKVVWP